EAVLETPAFERVLLILRQVQQRHPADFWVNQELGRPLPRPEPGQLLPPQTGQLEETLRYRAIAVALRPQSPGAHLNLAIALKAKGRWDEAIDECREAIRLDKDDVDAYNTLGNALCDKGRLEEGIDAYREAIRLNNDFPDALDNLGQTLDGMGR